MTIVEDIAIGPYITRITFLMATMRKNPKLIWQSKI
jgi:hypothetical protein